MASFDAGGGGASDEQRHPLRSAAAEAFAGDAAGGPDLGLEVAWLAGRLVGHLQPDMRQACQRHPRHRPPHLTQCRSLPAPP